MSGSSSSQPLIEQAVLVATRDPRGHVTSGRSAVLKTAIQAASTLAHQTLVVFPSDGNSAPSRVGGVTYHPWRARDRHLHIRGARTATSLNSVAGFATFSGLTWERLRALLPKGASPSLIVLDGVRTQCLLDTLPPDQPVFAEMEDLLSVRYDAWSKADLGGVPFALQANRPGSRLNRIAQHIRPVLPRLFGLEAALVRRSETWMMERSSAFSLVSQREIDLVTKTHGRKGFVLPMASPDMPRPLSTRPLSAAKANRLVFVGDCSYLPNMLGLTWFGRNVLPRIRVEALEVLIAGKCPPTSAAHLHSMGMKPVGHVPSLEDFMDAAACAIAPQVVGGGLNTKVLTYMSHNVPVVASTLVVDGFQTCPPGVTSARDATAFALAVEAQLRGSQSGSGDVSEWVHENFGPDVVNQRWQRAFHWAMAQS